MSDKPIEGPEDLTPLQRKYLRNMREYFESPPTLAKIYTKSWRQYFLLLLIAAIGIAYGIVTDVVGLSFLIGAFIAGAVIRDLNWFITSLRLWPATKAIVDRKRLEELTADSPYDSYTHDGP